MNSQPSEAANASKEHPPARAWIQHPVEGHLAFTRGTTDFGTSPCVSFGRFGSAMLFKADFCPAGNQLIPGSRGTQTLAFCLPSEVPRNLVLCVHHPQGDEQVFDLLAGNPLALQGQKVPPSNPGFNTTSSRDPKDVLENDQQPRTSWHMEPEIRLIMFHLWPKENRHAWKRVGVKTASGLVRTSVITALDVMDKMSITLVPNKAPPPRACRQDSDRLVLHSNSNKRPQKPRDSRETRFGKCEERSTRSFQVVKVAAKLRPLWQGEVYEAMLGLLLEPTSVQPTRKQVLTSGRSRPPKANSGWLRRGVAMN